jgi:hypothetical protein
MAITIICCLLPRFDEKQFEKQFGVCPLVSGLAVKGIRNNSSKPKTQIYI